MNIPLSILGFCSQPIGSSPPPTGVFYFSPAGTDYGNLGDWFMDNVSSIPASRVPASGDDVYIASIPNFSPSLTERTYKSIEFGPTVTCLSPSTMSFFKSPVKFITSSGDIVGAPTSLVADLESAAGIGFANPSGIVPEYNKLAGTWVAVGNIVLSDYYHGDEPLAMTTPSQVTCTNYTLSGCLDFLFPGNATLVSTVTITQNVDGFVHPGEINVARCGIASITFNIFLDASILICPDGGDNIDLLNLTCSDYFNLSCSGTVAEVNVFSGFSEEFTTNTNLSLYGSSVISSISITGNLSYESESKYITSRQAGESVAVVGQIYIGGYEHQKLTLTGGPLSTGSYDILVYNGLQYNLYDAADSFNYVGLLAYTGSWDLNLGSVVEGSWASGSPPTVTDWSSGTMATEPTWGSE